MMPFASIRFFKELVIHSYASLFIQIAATLQVKMTDNSTRWKPKITDDVGDILPTRNPCIGKKQCQSEEALLSLAVFSVMYEDFMLSMTYCMLCTGSKTRHGQVHRKNNIPHLFPHVNACV